MAVPFTVQAAKDLVEQERHGIDRIVNSIETSSSPCRGITRKVTLCGSEMPAYVLYNPERQLASRNDLYTHVTWLKKMVEEGKKVPAFQHEIERYFIIHKTGGKDTKATVEIIQEEIEKTLATSGWMVILGNGEINAQQAHDIYRRKDVVEKAFNKYKNFLGLDRLRVHGDQRMMNKLFTAFLSLILVSHIHTIMKEKDLYRKMTMEKLLMTMSKLKMVAINGHTILRPLTKDQLEILKAFSIPRPLVG
jgi:hypothetical protein